MSPFTGDRHGNHTGKSHPQLAASVVDACPAVAAKAGNALLKLGLPMLLLERLGIRARRQLDNLDGPIATTESEEVHNIGRMPI